MIEFKNVSYTYANTQTPAVSDINFTVASGELKLVTGASGCGKTTLMRLANGLCPQIYGGRLEGSVTVAGLNVSETPVADLSEVIGTLFQDPEEQFFALNAGDEIAFALRSRSFDPKDVRERTLKAARKLGIEELLTRDIHALSEGQKQKVGLAAILALGSALAFLLQRVITRPVEALQKRIETVGSGNFAPDRTVEWNNELGDIGRGINKMSGNITALMDRRLEDEKQKQDLEYRMLQNQINPHFIYNTLNSIKWMATIQHAPGIAEMVTALSRLLKSVSKGNERLVPLYEEFALLNDYFTIQQYRYGGTITLENAEGGGTLVTISIPTGEE